MSNRLALSTSPYLQQHAENPVDWYEWGDEAFAAARERDVPLLISVGYSACHWCHVMAHESFEDAVTAAFMNEHFVNVKVDREERPDVDAVYMSATQALTGQGGWPMTVVATPTGEPFYCGTYFPPVPAHGMPSFRQVLAALADAWQTRRDEVLTSAEQIRTALAQGRDGAGADGAGADGSGPRLVDQAVHAVLDPDLPGRAVGALVRSHDAVRGGFGGAPKFPPSMVLEWLLRHHRRTGSADAATMTSSTLDAMARGGMYDQLAGGFARYSVDAAWVVPHFEKMLYDNALLLRVYTHWWRDTGDPLARRVVEETADFLLRELRTPEGGFASALDADSARPDGTQHEGTFYVWTPGELVEVLGEDDSAWAASVWGVTAQGTFEQGASVLQLREDPQDSARYESVRERLLAARELRPRPGRDDKVVAAWNGLAIAALADAGVLLDRPAWVEAARGAALLLLEVHRRADGRLARTSRDGAVGSAAGVLEDYAHVAEGFLALYQATADPSWVERAGELLDVVLDRFADGAGGFHDTADDQTDPVLARLGRPREIADGPTPGGQPAAAGALLTYAALTGSHRHREAAVAALAEPLLIGERVPRASGWALAVAEAVLDGPREVAVVGPLLDPATQALLRAARAAGRPGAVLAVGGAADGVVTADEARVVPLLDGRRQVGGVPTAYVCRGFVCDLPTGDPAVVAGQLGG